MFNIGADVFYLEREQLTLIAFKGIIMGFALFGTSNLGVSFRIVELDEV